MLDSGWFSRRLRMCAPDLDAWLVDHTSSIPEIGDNGPGVDQSVCGSCGSSWVHPADVRPVIAYAYPKGSPPIETYGNWCTRCTINLKESLGLTLRSSL